MGVCQICGQSTPNKRYCDRLCWALGQQGSGNPFWRHTHSHTTRATISKTKRAQALAPWKGKHLPVSMRRKISQTKQGCEVWNAGKKTVYSTEALRKMRQAALRRIQKRHGVIFPNHNPIACLWFAHQDRLIGTRGQYATNGGEYYIQELGYWLDYINHDLRLIIEWDESHHYDANGCLHLRDQQRQQEIQAHFPDYEFIRIAEVA